MTSSPSEIVRRSVRSLMPRRAYQALADALDAGYCVAKLGWSGWRQIQSIAPSRSTTKGRLIELRLPSLRHPISVRAGTSDVQEVVYVGVRETYGAMLPAGEVRTIVDAGANIGDSAAWYLSRYSEGRLVAIEPHAENFRLLDHNLRPYGDRVALVRGALWPRRGVLGVRPAADFNSISVEETSGGADCEAVTMPQILEKFGIDRIDIFKCDIEGAERQLFEEGCDPWLDRTRFIAIETHGPECLSAVETATRRHGFRHRRHRNVHFFHR